MYNAIDYAVHQIVYDESEEMMNYLKEINCTLMVKHYSLQFEYAASLIEKIIEQHHFTLEKQEEQYYCVIDKQYIGTSLYPSMAVCLAILDLHGKKESFETHAQSLVKEDIEGIERRKKELEERLKNQS